MKKINLTDYEVKIKEDLTYGESKDIQEVILDDVKIDRDGSMSGISAKKMREMIYKTLETVIEEIKDDEGEEQEFSQEWMDNLPLEDGNKLEDEANRFLGQDRS